MDRLVAMYVVGLTGGIGSGKSAVAKAFVELGIEVIDADQLSRDAVAPGSTALDAIAKHFGAHLLNDDGSLDRRALREIVFADNDAKLWLENLLHPLIADLLAAKVAASQSAYTIVESPLLLETSQKELANRVLVVDVSEEIQLERALARDGGNEETIRAIIASQMSRAKRLEYADDVLNNEDPLETIPEKVKSLHQHYLKLSSSNE